MTLSKKGIIDLSGPPSQAYMRVKPLYGYLELLQARFRHIKVLPRRYRVARITRMGTVTILAPVSPNYEGSGLVYRDLHYQRTQSEGPRGMIERHILEIINELMANSPSPRKEADADELEIAREGFSFKREMRELFQANGWTDAEEWIKGFNDIVKEVSLTPRQIEPVRSPDGRWKNNFFPVAASVMSLLSIDKDARRDTGVPVYLQVEGTN